MDLTALLGPAVVAAVVSAIVAVVGFWLNRSTTLTVHEQKLKFDQELADRKALADIALAEKKLSLDRGLADWKRRTELAEEILTEFYKARDVFYGARRPLSSSEEGKSRKPLDGETAAQTFARNAIYVPYERLAKHVDFLSNLHAKRYRFRALFGEAAAKPFEAFLEAHNDVAFATSQLIEDHEEKGLDAESRKEYRKLIGWTARADDPVARKLDDAVAAMEAICRPIIESHP